MCFVNTFSQFVTFHFPDNVFQRVEFHILVNSDLLIFLKRIMNKQLSYTDNKLPRATENHSKIICLVFLLDYSIAPNVLNSINFNLPHAADAEMSVANFISFMD